MVLLVYIYIHSIILQLYSHVFINDYKLFTSIILWYTHKLNLQPRLAYKN